MNSKVVNPSLPFYESTLRKNEEAEDNSNDRWVDFHPAAPGSNPRMDTMRIHKVNTAMQIW